MDYAFVRRRIKWWEILRLPFNAVCVAGAWSAWRLANAFTVAIDEWPSARLMDPGAVRYLLFGFAVLNIAYCLIYAVEFVMAGRQRQSWSRGAQLALFCFGCVIGFLIASRGAAQIAKGISAEKQRSIMLQKNIERLGEKGPNQSPEPTVMSVTPRACARVAPATTVAHL